MWATPRESTSDNAQNGDNFYVRSFRINGLWGNRLYVIANYNSYTYPLVGVGLSSSILGRNGIRAAAPLGLSKSGLRPRTGPGTCGYTSAVAHRSLVHGGIGRFQKNRQGGKTKVTSRLGQRIYWLGLAASSRGMMLRRHGPQCLQTVQRSPTACFASDHSSCPSAIRNCARTECGPSFRNSRSGYLSN